VCIEDLVRASQDHADGKTWKELARELGVGTHSLMRRLVEVGLAPKRGEAGRPLAPKGWDNELSQSWIKKSLRVEA
jgi:Zn-dependent peptidase ImmA (M78 family)